MQQVKDSGLEWTRITTGTFFCYLFSPIFGIDLKTGQAKLAGGPDIKVDGTSRVDIGALVPFVLHHPSSRNAHVKLVGDTQPNAAIVQAVNQYVLPSHGGGKKQLEVTYANASELQEQQKGKNPNDVAHLAAGLKLATLSQRGVVEKADSWNARYLPDYVMQTYEQYCRSFGSIPSM